MTRYQAMFKRLNEKNEAAFIPFTVMGYPDREGSYDLIRLLIENGADALELGIPFSDPVADGPVIQAAGSQALSNGFSVKESLALLKRVRGDYPDIPIGLLLYANLVFANGVETFIASLAECGVDSLLIADVPLGEGAIVRTAAEKHGIDVVFIVPPNADQAKVEQVGQSSRGYVYMLGRKGVTGTGAEAELPSYEVLKTLEKVQAPPAILGFGISTPDHVKRAVAHGLDGVIAGSAIVERVPMLSDGRRDQLAHYVRDMKKATLR